MSKFIITDSFLNSFYFADLRSNMQLFFTLNIHNGGWRHRIHSKLARKSVDEDPISTTSFVAKTFSGLYNPKSIRRTQHTRFDIMLHRLERSSCQQNKRGYGLLQCTHTELVMDKFAYRLSSQGSSSHSGVLVIILYSAREHGMNTPRLVQ